MARGSSRDLLMPECANILWKKVVRWSSRPTRPSLPAGLLQRAAVELVPTRALLTEALRLAVTLAHPAYDCIYLALAIDRGIPFVTADERLVRVVEERASTFAEAILPLRGCRKNLDGRTSPATRAIKRDGSRAASAPARPRLSHAKIGRLTR